VRLIIPAKNSVVDCSKHPLGARVSPPPTRAKKYVLVEITPQDGPIDRSDGCRLNNNLAVKWSVIRADVSRKIDGTVRTNQTHPGQLSPLHGVPV
jgi:hypothetical protein